MLSLKRHHGGIAAFVLVAASSAYAEQPTPTNPSASEACPEPTAGCPQPARPAPVTQPAPIPPPQAAEAPAAPEAPWYRRFRWGLSAGGGVDDFTGSMAQDVTSIGGTWNVRLTMGTRAFIAGEVLYFGSAQAIQTIGGFDSSAYLIGNGLQANVRANLMKDYIVQPFVYSGPAWRHYDVTNRDFALADVDDSADVFEVPLGIGLAGYYQGFMGDLRAEYRWAWGDDWIADNDDMDRWNVTGNIGIEL
jgi:hypothetical protein